MKDFGWFNWIFVIGAIVYVLANKGVEGLLEAICIGIVYYCFVTTYDRIKRIETNQKQIMKSLNLL